MKYRANICDNQAEVIYFRYSMEEIIQQLEHLVDIGFIIAPFTFQVKVIEETQPS